MNTNWRKTKKTVALCGIIWFATIIDACYTWFLPNLLCHIIGTPFVIYGTILLKQKNALVVSAQRRKMFALFFCLFAYLLLTHFHLLSLIKYPLLYSPIFCLFFWPKSVLYEFYKYLRTFVIFYAIVSIIVEILVLSNLYTKLPYVLLPPRDNVQELHGIVNRFYGFFVIPENPNGLIFYRAMGPLREGGHFSIFLGFVYFVEKVVLEKRNAWIIISGFLTLSPNFVFFFIIAEGYDIITLKYNKKNMMSLACIIMIVVGAIWFSPNYIKDEIFRIIFERSLEESIENAGTNGYMELLDGRTNMSGIQMWNHFVKHEDFLSKLIGMSGSEFEELFVLSDFRLFILRYGYLGFFLFLICLIAISFGDKKNTYSFCVFILGLWVIISRAWMFYNLYIWTMMLLAINAKSIQDLNYHSRKKRVL